MPYYQRHLPHWQPEEAWLFVTWRLAGSLPAMEGPHWLNDARVASMVCEVIRQAESPRRLCRLGGYVVMSNHVHLPALPLETAAGLTHWIKGVSARSANRILNRTGAPFWQHESFDHWVRDSREYGRIKELHRTESRPGRARRQL